MKKKISIIASFRNEETNINSFIRRIKNSFKKFRNIDYKLIFIDDFSNDSSNNLIKKAIKKNKKIQLITFKKNYGHNPSVQTGFNFVRNRDYAVVIDCDLQEDPELIAQNFHSIKKNQTIHFVRKKREDPFFQRFYSKIAYLFLHFISSGKIIMNTNHFKIIPPFVVKKINKNKERDPYWNYLFTKYSRDNKIVYYIKRKRHFGISKYSIFTLNPWIAFYGGIHYFKKRFRFLILSLLLINIMILLLVLYNFTSFFLILFSSFSILILIANLFISFFMAHYKKKNKRIYCKYK